MGEEQIIPAESKLVERFAEEQIIAVEQLPAAAATEPKKGPPAEVDVVSFSNSIRLTLREWLGVGAFTLLFVLFAPALWKHLEPFEPGSDYRIPHDLSQDYWLCERWAAQAAAEYDTMLVGDSVIWGEYVTRQQTLSHYLNERAGSERFANLGLDGAHPLALSGLVKHYAGAISGKNVVLLCNPLWLSSPRADLTDDKLEDFNHPRLVPQDIVGYSIGKPQIPAYKVEISPRIGVLVEQRVPFNSWTNHLQQAYYDRMDIPSWTLEHPYENPLKQLAQGLPPSDNSLRHTPQPWYKSGIAKQDYPWVDLNTSPQWRAFQRVVEVLQQRGNRVLVVVGPFNDHLLTETSLGKYQKVKSTIAAWLAANQVPCLMPEALPSELYGDASHPLAAGYEMLAQQLWGEAFFQQKR